MPLGFVMLPDFAAMDACDLSAAVVDSTAAFDDFFESAAAAAALASALSFSPSSASFSPPMLADDFSGRIEPLPDLCDP